MHINILSADHSYKLTVMRAIAFYDRFFVLDGTETEGFFVDVSLKDADKRSFAVTRMEDAAMVYAIVQHHELPASPGRR